MDNLDEMHKFLERYNLPRPNQEKIHKPLARVIKKIREKTQINRIRNEKGEETTGTVEIQRTMRD